MTDKSLKNKTIKVKGGASYAQVKDRVLWLDENKNGAYSIQTKYDFFPEHRMWVVKATLTVDGQVYTGHAQEIESDDYKSVNHTSALENCETSAIGRACAAYGLGIQESYASQDEISKAQTQAKPATDKQIEMLRKTASRITGEEHKEAIDEWIEKVIGVKPEKLSTKSAWSANNKLLEAEKAQQAKQREELDKDPVYTDIPKGEVNLDKVPY